ncbi:aminopeptidase P family protein [Paraflavitalea pollutisoli]|uniref:aminopeptidase P family protein n=1 Tax=Paraflavitalea pollutisoli TaxID=3034143 RepID=UPI0023EB4173|nr:aminopeptidase P family protein [Paraflavitalea sp. H1-2-19X]
MRLRHFVIGLALLASSPVFAQPAPLHDLADDYLTPAFHAGRRDSLRQLMPANSVTVVLAFPTRNFSNDVDYVYHQNPDLYYFSGYKEPHSLMLIFKEPQTAANGSTFKEVLFVQKRNAQAEQWTGKRMGVEGAKEKLGLATVYNGEEFKNFAVDFSKFDKIIIDRLPTDVADARGDNADLYDLLKQLKEKAQIPDNYQQDKRFGTGLFRQYTGQLREIKTEEEVVLLRKAVEISCHGQAEVMKAVKPDMSEREVQGLHEYVHKKYGAEYVGYPSIVGAGNNGCVLHYTENEKLHVENKMVLMDVGAEYHGYTADVTRTVPANGKFTAEQKAIYEIVYEAQEAAFKLCKEGTSWQELDRVSRGVVADGLIKLGIITKKEDVNKYYPHGLGHHIGLDVHDRSASGTLKKGMVITIEPGIYIPENSPCDKKWWTIAVRIEDDLLIKEKDYELLSWAAPRKASDIEKTVAEKSPLDQFTLPKLQSGKKGF